MIRIAICDDSSDELNKLKNIISDYFCELHIDVEISGFINELLFMQDFDKFNAVFLDIKMKNLYGTDIAKYIRETNLKLKIIFVSYYADYYNIAFSVRAFGYITKPYSTQQIHKQIDDIVKYEEFEKPSATFETDIGIKTIFINDIIYFEYKKTRIKVETIHGIYLIKDTLSSILARFEKYGFAMPHKSFIVNYNFISRFMGYDIILNNDEKIPISQKRMVSFKKSLHYYLSNNFNCFGDDFN